MTIGEYILDSQDLKQKYVKVCNVINALYDQAIVSAGSSDISSYSVDDGQTKLSTTYRSMDDVERAIVKFTRLKNMLARQISGTTIVRLADSQSVYSRGFLNRN